MPGLTNVKTDQPKYFPPTNLHAIGKRRSNLNSVPRVASVPPPISDLSVIYPEAVVASSEALGWQYLRAIQMRQQSEWTMPPLENHCVIIQLGQPVEVSAQIGAVRFIKSVQPGEITIVPAGVALHWRQATEGNESLHLYIHPHVVRRAAESIDFNYARISMEPQFSVDDEHIRHVGLSLHCELKEANVIGKVYADALTKVLAMQLVRRYSYLKDVHASVGGMAPRKLRKAIEFINVNLDQEQTVALAAVAQEVQMSYFHFSRAFKQSTGVSPNVYMIEQRIKRAKKLLAETDLPIADIALRAGFASQSHFTTTFRRLAWTTPKAFREMA